MNSNSMIRKNWFEANGDETLALDWPLTPMSHVWEIGGFEGRWAKQMSDKFGCFIDVFEPQGWAVERMEAKFAGNDKITIHPYGLWIDTAYLRIGKYGTDGATVMGSPSGDNVEMGAFRLYSDVMRSLPHPINVGLMNIEGTEWLLLPAMINTGWIKQFDHFWCQFHTEFMFSETQYDDIVRSMENTHEMIWDCYPTAVAWRRK